MKKIAVAVAGALFVTLMPGAAFAQTFTIPDRIEKLSARARESTNITLDGAIDLKQISKLGGSFGIPKDLPNAGPPPGKESTGKDSPE